MVELTFKDFLDLTYNPRRINEARKLFRDWYGSDWANRLFAKAEMFSTDANVRNINYGAPAQDWMNYETNVFSLLNKVPWGPKSGLRFVDLSSTEATGLQETGNLMAASNATYGIIEYDIKYHNLKFAATEKSLWRGTVDDNIDRWAIEREKWGKVLGRSIDEYLVRPVNTVTGATFVIESLDRMVSSSAEATFLVSSGGLTGATAADIYPYAQRLRRSGFAGTGYGNGPYDAVVDENAGVLESLTLKDIDDALVQVELNGASRDGLILLTGPDTANEISAKLEARERFVSKAPMRVTLNGVVRASDVGVPGGIEVLSYKGVPIFTSRALWANRPTGGLSDIFGLYLPHIYVAVAMPTLFLETQRDDWLLLDRMRRIGAYFFGAELVFRQWNTHFKIIDKSA